MKKTMIKNKSKRKRKIHNKHEGKNANNENVMYKK